MVRTLLARMQVWCMGNFTTTSIVVASLLVYLPGVGLSGTSVQLQYAVWCVTGTENYNGLLFCQHHA